MNRFALLLAALALLAACSTDAPSVLSGTPPAPSTQDPKSFTCCDNPERFPAPVALLGANIAPLFASSATSAPIRPGLLKDDPAAWRYMFAKAQPLDIYLLSNKNWTSGRIVPGLFSHSTVYVGGERELKALGVWNAPEIVPYHAALRAGKTVIEGVNGGVRLIPPEGIDDSDGAVALRPVVGGIAEKRAAIRALFSRMGAPFDYTFDLRSCDKIACTELIGHSMPQVGFVVREVYGFPMIIPDDIAAQAVRGENLSVVAYVRWVEGGWAKGGVRELMADMDYAWSKTSPHAGTAPVVARTSASDQCTVVNPRG